MDGAGDISGFSKDKLALIAPTLQGIIDQGLLSGAVTLLWRNGEIAQVLTLGKRAVRLYPIFHPAAALYTPRMLETLREDFMRLPDLLALGAPEQPSLEEIPEVDEPETGEAPEAELSPNAAQAAAGAGNGAARSEQVDEPDQLGLF